MSLPLALLPHPAVFLPTGVGRLDPRVWWPAVANFVLVDVQDGATFRRVLLPCRIVVRDCASVPGSVRIARRLSNECPRLITTLAQAPEVLPRATA